MDSEKRIDIPDNGFMPDINGHDSVSDTTHRGANILRERTFNEDLKSILSRIRDNEGPGIHTEITLDQLKGLSEEEFVLALHSLFYRIKSADDIVDSSVCFDPYEGTDIPETAGAISWEKIFDARMKTAGFAEYALLAYDFGLRSFVPLQGSMNMEMGNIAISLRDGLYRKIRESEYGLFLDSSIIEVDDWLSKLFRPVDKKDYMLYFVRSGILTAQLLDSFAGLGDAPSFPLDGRILMIRFTDTADLPTTAELRSTLEREIAILLALSIGHRAPDIRSIGLDDPDIQISLVEYLVSQYSAANDGLCVVISVSKSRAKEFIFIIKYLIAKLKKSLWKYSSIVQISGTCILVLSRQPDEAFIKESIAEINRYYDDVLQIDFLDGRQIADLSGFIHALFMR